MRNRTEARNTGLMRISPSSTKPGARVPEGTVFEAGCIISGDVMIGKNCKFGPNCVIQGPLEIGSGNVFSGLCCIGCYSQDLKAKEGGSLVIGDNNIFREFTVISRATGINKATLIGNYNIVSAYAHIAHECKIGSNNTISTGVQLAGHVIVGDGAVLGAGSMVHQYCRIGSHSHTDNRSILSNDLPPFTEFKELENKRDIITNFNGLKRAGMNDDQISKIDRALSILFYADLSMQVAAAKINELADSDANTNLLGTFLLTNKTGIVRPRLR